MNTLEREFLNKITDSVQEELGETKALTEDAVDRIAKKIEKNRKYRVKDYESALAYFRNITYYMAEDVERGLGKGNKENLDLFEESKRVVVRILENRRARNREISKVDTNILTHAPYFSGGSKKRKQKGKEDGYILIEKQGLRHVTYENETGVMLTMADAKTLFALFSMWEDQGYQDWIRFTEYQLLETLNLKIGGKQYAMVRNSLEKLWNTSIVMEEAYDVKTGTRKETKRFKLIVADKVVEDYNTVGELRSKKYEIQFSNYVNASIEGGYYSLISLAVFNELEIDTAQGLYLMMTGINDMDKNDAYIRQDGCIDIDLEEVYHTLFLESAKYRNRELVERGCEELKEVGVLNDYHFVYKGRSAKRIVLEPSDWHLDVIKKKETKLEIGDSEQLSFEQITEETEQGTTISK